MRRLHTSWTKTLTTLGFKRVFKKKKSQHRGRRPQLENLEARQMLSIDPLIVDTHYDIVDPNDGLFSLREAVSEAHANGATTVDKIKFDESLAGKTIALTSEIDINSDLSIEGLGVDELRISGEDQSRIFDISSSAEVTLKDLTIERGYTTGAGGAVQSAGDLTLSHVAIVDSESGYRGGALHHGSGSLTINNSTFDGNLARYGGGISVFMVNASSETADIRSSTFSNNRAIGSPGGGGGVFVWGGSNTGTVVLANNTISGNESSHYGGGVAIFKSVDTTLVNNTIADNNVLFGNSGGLSATVGADPVIQNTIIATNTAPNTDNARLDAGVNAANAANLFDTDPKLAPLGDYGGATMTHAVLEGSPAIDAGDQAKADAIGLTGDQRASEFTIAKRSSGSALDAGAFEYGVDPMDTVTPFEIFTLSQGEFVFGHSNTPPWVATNGTGESIVVWEGVGDEGLGIYYQIVNQETNAVSQPRRINLSQNSEYSSLQLEIQAGIDDAGNFIVAWRADDDGIERVYMRRYLANGTPIDVLPELISHDDGLHAATGRMSVVTNGSGRSVVSWQTDEGIYFRRYTTTGLSLDAAPVLAVDLPAGTELSVATSGRSVAITESGDFFLLYASKTGQDTGVYTQRFNASGLALGSPLEVINTADSSIPIPIDFVALLDHDQAPDNESAQPFDIVLDQNEEPIVAWRQSARWNYHEPGEPVGSEYLYGDQLLLSRPAAVEQTPATEVASGLIASFDSTSDPSETYVVDYRFDLDQPGLAIDNFGRVGVAWRGDHFDNNHTITYDQNGDPVYFEPGISHSDISVRWFDASLQAFDNIYQLNRFDAHPDHAFAPSLASDASGRFLLTGVAGDKLYGKRFHLSNPIGLVDDREAGFQLVIDNQLRQEPSITVGSTIIQGERYVTLNGIATTINTDAFSSVFIDGGPGDTRIDLSQVTSEFFPNLSDATELPITIHGGAGNDVIYGSEFGEVIKGGEGDDTIFAGGGNDQIHGGEGSDTLYGDAGNDKLYGDAGDDTLRGGIGNDELHGGDDDDLLLGQAGDDDLFGEAGNDRLDSGSGTSELLDGGADDDTFVITEITTTDLELNDSGGVDTIDFSDASFGIALLDLGGANLQFIGEVSSRTLLLTSGQIENVIGTPFNDVIVGNELNNRIDGGRGNDDLSGGLGDDVLLGQAGDDTLQNGEGSDSLQGGEGKDEYKITYAAASELTLLDIDGVNDTLDFSGWDAGSGAQGVRINLGDTEEEQYLDAAGTHLLTNTGLDAFETVIGSNFDDKLTGNALDNTLQGGDGRDELIGGGGNNVLLGEGGLDVVEVVDNATELSGWSDSDDGYNRSQAKLDPSNATNPADASWTFNDLPEGEYDVYVTWNILDDPTTVATNASYAITTETGTTSNISVDQSLAPATPEIAGPWQSLGRFTVGTDNTLAVVLSASANGLLYADAVRVVRHNQLPVLSHTVVAEGEFAVTGTDPDGDAAQLSLAIDPTYAGNVIVTDVTTPTDAANGEKKWTVIHTPPASQTGTFPLVLALSDGDVTSVTTRLQVDATHGTQANSAPTSIEFDGSTAGDLFDWGSTDEGVALTSLEIKATDPNSDPSRFVLTTSLDAPDGITFSQTGVENSGQTGVWEMDWTPSDQQSGDYEFDVYVTAPGHPPLRVTRPVKVSVAGSGAELVSFELLNDTGDNTSDPTTKTSDSRMVGTVRSDRPLNFVDIEVSYSDGTGAFSVDDVVSLSISDDDPTIATFEISPSIDELRSYLDLADTVTTFPVTVKVRTREWLDTDTNSDPIYERSAESAPVTFEADTGANVLPTFASLDLQHFVVVNITEKHTANPVVAGQVTHADGSNVGLKVEVYHGTSKVGDARTDADGRFEIVPEGLPVPTGSTPADITLSVKVFEHVTLASFENSQVDTEQPLLFKLHKQTAPEITSTTVDQSGLVPVLKGTVDVGPYMSSEGVTVEFFSDSALSINNALGAAVTDASGNFEFVPTDLTSENPITIYAQAVIWDDYVNDFLTGKGPSATDVSWLFTYDSDSTATPTLTTPQFVYPPATGNDPFINPTVSGQALFGTEPAEGIEVAFYWANPEVEVLADPIGYTTTDDAGYYEFLPLGLEVDAEKTLFIQATAPGVNKNDWKQSSVETIAIELTGEASVSVSANLAYDTGSSNSDNITALPIISGAVTYAGNKEEALVDITYVNDQGVEQLVTVSPDSSGVFSYKFDDLAEADPAFDPTSPNSHQHEVKVSARVPNYGAIAPEFTDNLLGTGSEGELLAGWFAQGYDFGDDVTPGVSWNNLNNIDTDENGVPDFADEWLANVFDGTADTNNFDWSSSDFERDWEGVFDEVTSDEVAVEFTLKSGEATTPEVSGLVVPNGTLNPTIEGSLTDPTGQTTQLANQRLAIYVDGELDGEVTTDAAGTFKYTTTKHQPKPSSGTYDITIKQINESDDSETTLTTASASVSVDSNLEVASLDLKSGVYNVLDGVWESVDPTLTGTINTDGFVALQTVQFDYDGDGVSDAEALTDGLGRFEFVPVGLGAHLNAGIASVRARLVSQREEVVSTPGEPDQTVEYTTYSEWTTAVDWKVLTNDPPVITQFGLANDTGNQTLGYSVLDRVTSDPTLIGQVSDITHSKYVTVEFSLDGGATFEASNTVTTDNDGRFRFTPPVNRLGGWDIRARVSEYDPVTETTLGNHPVAITATGIPSYNLDGTQLEDTDSYYGFTLVAPSIPSIESGSLKLANTGQQGLSNTYDPSIAGRVDNADSTAGVVVNVYETSAGQRGTLLGTAVTDSEGNFTFIPTGLTNGPHEFEFVPVKTDFVTGFEIEGVSDTVPVNFQPDSGVVIASTSVTFDEENEDLWKVVVNGFDNQSNDEPSGPTIAFFEVAINGDPGNGTAEQIFTAPASLVSSVDPGNGNNPTVKYRYEFSYEHDLRESPLSSFYVRSVELNGVGFKYGLWLEHFAEAATDDQYHAPSPTLTAAVDAAATLTPTITGTVANPTHVRQGTTPLPASALSDAVIEIDLNLDGFVDEVVYPTDGNFSYELSDYDPGLKTIAVRASSIASFTSPTTDLTVEQQLETEWQIVEFEFANPGPIISPILANPSTSAEATYDPLIEGVVTDADGNAVTREMAAGMIVEVDYDRDGIADGRTFVDQDGSFEYRLPDLTPGPVEVLVRAIDTTSANRDLEGDWVSLSFLLEAHPAGTLNSLSLKTADTSGLLPATNEPILVGSVSIDEQATQRYVEFDYDEDGLPDASELVDLYGDFEHRINNLPHGNVTVAARTVMEVGSQTIYGEWTGDGAESDLEFVHDKLDLPIVNDLQLVDAKLGLFTGRVTVDGYGESADVTLVVTPPSSGTPLEFSARSSANGFFRIQAEYLSKLAPSETYDVAVYASVIDPYDNRLVHGESRPLGIDFDYAPDPVVVPVLTEFELAYNTGDPTGDSGGIVTADPTLRGKVQNVSPGLTVDFRFNGDNSSVVEDVPVAADGTFELSPELTLLIVGGATAVEIRTNHWNPISGAVVSGWTQTGDPVEPVSFTYDISKNNYATINEFTVYANDAGDGLTPVTKDPAFVGKIDNDGGRLGGHTITFDHNGDGLIDGHTLTKADGTFFYRAEGLEPSDLLEQTITARLQEVNYEGVTLTAFEEKLDFYLTRSPLVTSVDYNAAADKVTGSVWYEPQVAIAAGDLVVEYQVFGAGAAQSDPPTNPQGYTPANSTTVVVTDGAFEIANPTTGNGTATILVRSIDRTDSANPLAGPWRVLNFEVGEAASSFTPSIASLSLANDTGSTAFETSDPTVEGTIETGVSGAYTVIEVKTYRVETSGETLISTGRVTTNAQGEFAYVPHGLSRGDEYRIEAYTVGFDISAGVETFGTTKSGPTFTLLNADAATITGFKAIDWDPIAETPIENATLEGTVTNPDGRIDGLRIEFDTDNNGEADGFAFTNSVGYFTYTPRGLTANSEPTIKARVVEWDPVSNEFVRPDFDSTSGEIAVTSFDLAASYVDPTLHENIQDDAAVAELARDTARDAVFGAMHDLNLDWIDNTEGRIDVELGTAQALHFGGSDLEPGEALAKAFEFDGTVAAVSQQEQSPIATSITLESGAHFDYNYNYTRSVSVDPNTNNFSATIFVGIDIIDYEWTQSPSDLDQLVTELEFDDLTQTFTFTASGSTDGNGEIVSVTSFGILERLFYDYTLRDASTGGVLSSGDYDYIYRDADSMTQSEQTEAGDNGYSLQQLGAGAIVQPFFFTETNRVNDWQRNNWDGANPNAPRQSVDSTYVETITNSGVVTTNGGVSVVEGKLVIDATGTYDESYITSENDVSAEGDNDSQSQSSSEEHTHYQGQLNLTVEYTTGDSVDDTSKATFDLTETIVSSFNQSGAGSSTTDSSGSIERNDTESWGYSSSGEVTTKSTTIGTAVTERINDEEVTRLDAQLQSTTVALIEGSGHGSSQSSRNDTVNAGNNESSQSSGTFTFSTSTTSQYQANLARIEGPSSDRYTLEGNNALGYSSQLTETGNASGQTDTSEDADNKSSVSYATRSKSDVTVGGSSNAAFVITDKSESTLTTFSSSIGGTSKTASQSHGTSTVDGQTTPFRFNEVTDVSLSISNAGVDNGNGTVSGTVDSSDSSSYKSTEYVGGNGGDVSVGDRAVQVGGGSSGFSITKTTGQSSSQQQVNYTDSNGDVTTQGTFSTDTTSSVETVSGASGSVNTTAGEDYTQISFSSQEDSTARSTQQTEGRFNESGGNRSEQATSELSQYSGGSSSTSSKFSTRVTDGDDITTTTSISKQRSGGTTRMEGTGTLSLTEGSEGRREEGTSNARVTTKSNSNSRVTFREQLAFGGEGSSSKGNVLTTGSSVSQTGTSGTGNITVTTLSGEEHRRGGGSSTQTASVRDNVTTTAKQTISENDVTTRIDSTSTSKSQVKLSGSGSSTLDGGTSGSGGDSTTRSTTDLKSALDITTSQPGQTSTYESDVSDKTKSTLTLSGFEEKTPDGGSRNNAVYNLNSERTLIDEAFNKISYGNGTTSENGNKLDEVTNVTSQGTVEGENSKTTISTGTSDANSDGKLRTNSKDQSRSNDGGTRSGSTTETETTDDRQGRLDGKQKDKSFSNEKTSDGYTKSSGEGKSNSSSQANEDGSSNQSSGDKWDRVIKEKTADSTVTTKYRDRSSATFTSEGADQGDRQTLSNTISKAYEKDEESKVSYKGVGTAVHAEAAIGVSDPTYHETFSFDYSTTYNGSHSLGKDGESIGGSFIATSLYKEKDDDYYEGTSVAHYQGGDPEPTDQTITSRIIKDSTYTENRVFSVELGSYDDNAGDSGFIISIGSNSSGEKAEYKERDSYREKFGYPIEAHTKVAEDTTNTTISIGTYSPGRSSFQTDTEKKITSNRMEKWVRPSTEDGQPYRIEFKSEVIVDKVVKDGNVTGTSDDIWADTQYGGNNPHLTHPVTGVKVFSYRDVLHTDLSDDSNANGESSANKPKGSGVATGRESAGSSAWPGGAWNPGNWWRGTITGDASSSDESYRAAQAALGQSVIDDVTGDTGVGAAIDVVGGFIPIAGELRDGAELLSGTNLRTGEKLSGIERIATAGGFLIPFVGASSIRKLMGGAGELVDDAVKQADNANDAAKQADEVATEFGEGVTGKAEAPRDDIYDPETKQLKVLQDQCFAPETLVRTPEGQRPIREIRQGDTVLAYDHQAGEWCERQVEKFHESIYEGPLLTVHTDGGEVRTTIYHPFWVQSGYDLDERQAPRELKEKEDEGLSLPGRWVNSHELRCGDVLIGQDGQQRTVLRIEQEFVSGFLVHNLTISEDHTFAVGADGILVHNTGGCGPIIRNGHLAGKSHKKTGVPFDKDGFPDFSDHATHTVSINQKGNYTSDFTDANRKAGLSETPEGYTWHHHQDGKQMQLVPTDIHRKTGHTGGVGLR